MELIDLSCPKCGAPMKPNGAYTYAMCEYCGHGVLLTEAARQRLLAQKTAEALNPRAEEAPRTKTEEMRRALAEEKKNAPKPDAADAADTGLGLVLLRLFGIPFRIRNLISFAILLVCAAASCWLALRFYSAEFQTYYLIAGIAATVTGAFCLWVSYRIYRSVPLGVGLGILLSLLLSLLR